MLPDAAYPAPLPLTRKAALEFLDRFEDFGSAKATFLTFVQIPLEERVGEWRFAGAERSLAETVRRIEEFADAMNLNDPARPGGLLRRLLEDIDDNSEYAYPKESPRNVGGPHRVVLCVQYDAPHEGLGACIVEVESLAESSFKGRAPEAGLPKQWRKMAILWVLEEGAERFGPVPKAIKVAIRAEKRPEVWGNWQRRWAEFGGWEELIPELAK